VAIGGTIGATGVGVAATGIGDFPHGATVHMAWTIPTGLTWLFISGCAVVAWVVGYGVGYRGGVRDAIIGSIPKTDHRFDRD
jgi:hypothetical protein